MIFLFAGCATTLKVPTRLEQTMTPQESWALVLKNNVNEKGQVDFEGIKRSPSNLESYVEYVAHFGPRSHPEFFTTLNSKIAYYLNSYNALSMYNIIQSGIPKSLSGCRRREHLFL